MSKIKNLFSTPKKLIVFAACIVAVAAIGTGSVFAAEAVAEQNSIGKSGAGQIALSDAGIDASAAIISRTEFEMERGIYVYEVEFIANGIEYDYVINASDGEIIKKDIDNDTDRLPPVRQISSAPAENDGKDISLIDLDSAKRLAISDAGVESENVTYTKAQLEYDDGIQIYDIEFFTATTEYEYEINAVSGAIVDKSIEVINNVQNNPPQKKTQDSDIGIDSAKERALADAKLSASDVTYTKAQLEYDDGIQIYDIEFFTATTEYEYEINAVSGAVVDKSIEALSIQQTKPQEPPVQSTYIGVDNAKNIALSHAGLTLAEVTFQKAKLENDDGIVEYEIEFFKDGIEYEYTIDAVSGDVLEYESEYDD